MGLGNCSTFICNFRFTRNKFNFLFVIRTSTRFDNSILNKHMSKSTKKATTKDASEELVQWVVKGMQEKKAQEIVVMDMRGVANAFTDFFVVASGTSDTQIEAIADSVDKEVWESGKIHVHAMEGKANREWILMDYYDVIVHVFLKDKRDFFKLEELWGDAKFTHIAE